MFDMLKIIESSEQGKTDLKTEEKRLGEELAVKFLDPSMLKKK